MKRRLPTLSSLPLLAICPGAGALPWVGSVNESAALGNALHELMQDRIGGRPVNRELAEKWALTENDERCYRYLAESFCPDVPTGALAEVSLALLADGRVVRLPGGGRGEYPDAPPDAILAGSVDVTWAEPRGLHESDAFNARCLPDNTLAVYDWKTGEPGNVAPAARNWQIKGAALLASRWTGATKAIGGVCFVQPGPGRWEQHLFTDLDAIERELRALLHRVEEARLAVAAGEQPKLVTGAHCELCPARAACPAWVAPVRALMAFPEDYFDYIHPITSEQATSAAELLPVLRSFLDLCESAAKDGIRLHGPLTLKSGKVYGAAEETRETLAVRETYEALAEIVGEAAADGAFRVSKSGIRDALTEAGAPRGSYSKLMRALEEKGAISKRKLTVYRARHVPPPVAEAPALDLGPLADEPAEGSAT